MHDISVEILQNTSVNDSFSLLTFKYPYPVKPGQFVHVRLNEQIDPYLRRPFSIHDYNASKKQVTLLYKLIGKGTKYLALQPKGTKLAVLGPLGNTFDLTKVKKGSKVTLVGGGIGFAPLFYLTKELVKKKADVSVFIGFKTKKEIFIDPAWKKLCKKIYISTDDGTSGHKGFVGACFAEQMKKTTFDQVFTCGPELMMKHVYTLCTQASVPLQLSLESIMACALGACMCCVTETLHGYKKVCSDGPVFKREELQW